MNIQLFQLDSGKVEVENKNQQSLVTLKEKVPRVLREIMVENYKYTQDNTQDLELKNKS